MKKSTLDGYRKQLLEAAERLNGDVAQLSEDVRGESSGVMADEVRDPAELAARQVQQGANLELLDTEEKQREEISAALARLDLGTYGRCEKCGAAITAERLQAIPYTRVCIGCAQQL